MYTCNGLIDIFGFLSCKNTVSTCDQIMRIKKSMQFQFQKIPTTINQCNCPQNMSDVRTLIVHVCCNVEFQLVYYAMLSLVVSHGHYCV